MKGQATLTGVIDREVINKGSKSEHESIVLKTDNGMTIALKMKGANPFEINGALKPLVGNRATITGDLANSALYVADLSDVKIQPRRTCGTPPPPRPGM